jgi:hypothetical protein
VLPAQLRRASGPPEEEFSLGYRGIPLPTRSSTG